MQSYATMAATEISTECMECDILQSRYESAIFELARVENALGIAKHTRDREQMGKLTLDAFDATERQRNAKKELTQHRNTTHYRFWRKANPMDLEPIPRIKPA
jgi:hypothetical protein